MYNYIIRTLLFNGSNEEIMNTDEIITVDNEKKAFDIYDWKCKQLDECLRFENGGHINIYLIADDEPRHMVTWDSFE